MKTAYIVMVVVDRPEPPQRTLNGKSLTQIGWAPVYLDRAQALRDFPGATLIPIHVTEAPR